jgi:hypothetical protein
MKLNLAYIVGTLTALVGPHAFGQSVLTEAYLTGSGGVAAITNSLHLTIGIAPGINTPPALLFGDLFFQTADVGHTYTIGPGDDPNFARFATYLTDGQVSWVTEGWNVGPGGYRRGPMPETDFFASLPQVNNGIDLGGFEIDYFTLCFSTLNFVSPGSNPNGDGNWTDYSLSATFSVYGQPVPEPDSLATLCLGAAALIAKARRLTFAPANAPAAFPV